MIASAWRRRSAHTALAFTLLVAACAVPLGGAPEGPVVSPVAQTGWRFAAREHLALWYHGLSLVLPPTDSIPLAIYNDAEQKRALGAGRRPGGSATPLEAIASRTRAEFAGSSAYGNLQFLPLYFDDAQSLFTAIRLWNQAEGDPQRAGSQRAAEAVALLSGMFETPRQRRAVAEFAEALEAESRAYYAGYWDTREPELQPLLEAARREWSTLEDSLASLFNYLEVRSGEALLTPALGPEGRTVTARNFVRVAVGTPQVGSTPAAAASEVVFSILHELMYSLVDEPIREHVAPARVREFGEQVLETRAAVRAGAMVLERRAPHKVAEYRAYYLRMSGKGGTGDSAFRNAYALPLELVSGLGEFLDQALAGI
jgi:hypothetical protein